VRGDPARMVRLDRESCGGKAAVLWSVISKLGRADRWQWEENSVGVEVTIGKETRSLPIQVVIACNLGGFLLSRGYNEGHWIWYMVGGCALLYDSYW